MSMMQSQTIDHCLISGDAVTKILDLGQHPYADTFVRPDQLHLSEPVFPLHVYMNEASGQIQLRYISNAEERYNLYSYSYTSSNSKFARDHWDSYARSIVEKCQPQGLVVEIGSNDGYLINQFRSHGVPTLGVDSSKYMCDLAESQGQPCVNAVFDLSVAEQITTQHGTARLVIANNVFNHANDPVSFARGVAELLDHDGVFVFELPYWGAMVDAARFDQVYHEHVSYFTVKSSWNLLQAAGMTMTDFEHVDYHGGSIRVFAQVGSQAMSNKIQRAIQQETADGLFSVERYQVMQQQMIQQRDAWLQNFYTMRLQSPNAVIIGVGAAAKANTWLNWHGLNSSTLHCVTDSSAHKQGKFTPLSRIPIRGDEEFARHAEPIALILSWNISDGLKQALLKINPNTKFISQ
jgi:SAM-dependent methyltransferase